MYLLFISHIKKYNKLYKTIIKYFFLFLSSITGSRLLPNKIQKTKKDSKLHLLEQGFSLKQEQIRKCFSNNSNMFKCDKLYVYF